MGGTESKPKDEFDKIELKVPKFGDRAELPKLNLETTSDFKLPEKPKMKTREDLKVERSQMEGKRAFDIADEYDLSTYKGRFYRQLSVQNPVIFFTPTKAIKEAKAGLEKYLLRFEAAKNINSKAFLTE